MVAAAPQGGFVAHAEGAFEQARAGYDAGGAVNGEEHQDDDGRDHAQQLAVVFKAAGEIIRQRQGVVVGFGMYAQPSCHQLPVQVSADGQADSDPAFGDAGER